MLPPLIFSPPDQQSDDPRVATQRTQGPHHTSIPSPQANRSRAVSVVMPLRMLIGVSIDSALSSAPVAVEG